MRIYSSYSILSFLTVSVFALSACQTPVATSAPTPLQPTSAAVPVEPVVQQGVSSSTTQSLEDRVGVLEAKMRDAEPKLKKVDMIENHFQALSLELRMLAPAADSVPVTVPNIEIQPVAKPLPKSEKMAAEKNEIKLVPKKAVSAQEKPVVSKAKDLVITSMRVGLHGKNGTRIVLDATQSAEMRYDLDNNEGLLVVDLPKATWAAAKASLPKKSQLIQSVDAKTDEAGAHLVFQLSGKATVTATGRLSPSGKMGHRVYLDLTPVAN